MIFGEKYGTKDEDAHDVILYSYFLTYVSPLLSTFVHRTLYQNILNLWFDSF
jgi:hypothetical protein